MSQALTKADLVAVTGYKRARDQLKWLEARHIRPFVSSQGEITLLWRVLEKAQMRDCGMELESNKPKGPQPRLRSVK